MNKLIIFTCFLFLTIINSYSQSVLNQGKELFSQNKIEEALILFEEALITNPTEDTYKYLAESYNILGMHEDEVLVLEEAISGSVIDLSYFYFKLGNAYHLIGNYKEALDSYLEVLNIKNGYIHETFLNIANVSVELKLYSSAIDNYSKYLELEPNSVQKRKIIKMIFLLKKSYKEEQALLEKERLVKAEEDKLKEEERLRKELEEQMVDEERLNTLAENQDKEAEMELRARELEEERLLFDEEEKQLLDDKEKLLLAEEKVVNPPDPEIEAQKEELKRRAEELEAKEQKLKESALSLEQEREELSTLSQQIQKEVPREKTEEELKQEEMERLAREEQLRQEAVMSDILQSLEKIGENAKGINATSEGAYNELEGSDIDE